VAEALRRAKVLEQEGDAAGAKAIRAALEALYRDDPAASAQIRKE
jgi:hypothetical protein